VILFFCEVGQYQKINWHDYLHDIRFPQYFIGGIEDEEEVLFEGCDVGMILDFSWGGFEMFSEGLYDGMSDDGDNTLIQYSLKAF